MPPLIRYLYYDETGEHSLTPIEELGRACAQGGASTTSATSPPPPGSTTSAASSGSCFLYPIPVRVTNYKRNAQVVNKPGGLTTDDQLTRRFYVLDAVSGVSAGGGGASSGKLPEAVRYLMSTDEH